MKEDIVDQLLREWALEQPERDVSALGVVVRIQRLAKLQQRQTTRALKAHDLKHWEYDVMSLLRRQGAPFELAASDIARSVLLTSGATTTRIDGLESRGYVRRRRSKADGRSVFVRLTAKGKRHVDRAIDTRINEAEQALSKISLRDRVDLAAQLKKVLLEIDPKDMVAV